MPEKKDLPGLVAKWRAEAAEEKDIKWWMIIVALADELESVLAGMCTYGRLSCQPIESSGLCRWHSNGKIPIAD